jgi:uncharacterized lipoprotein YddW (UPF0748 family)
MTLRLVAALAFFLVGCSDPAPEPPPAPDAPAPARPPAERTRRGLWVLAEGSHRTLEDPARIEQLIEDALAVGATDLFVQVYRGGRSWYPSEHADDSPYRDLLARQARWPLPELIERAHAAGLRVHAWWNALSLATNRKAPLLQQVGRDAVLVDRQGRNLLDYPKLEVPAAERMHVRMGTPGVWLDPATPGVIEYLEQTLVDLVEAAPELDGLHLDFIRHPLALPIVPGSRFDVGLDFGYGKPAKDGFAAEHWGKFARGDAWDQYRRERVSDVVRRLHAKLPESWELSAAVLPWANRAYLSAMQDWRGWLEEDALDFAVAMAYTRDDRLLRYLVQDLRGGVEGDRVWIGLGTWLFLGDPEHARRQFDIAAAVEPAGVALFSYDGLVGAPEALDQFREPAP